MAFEAIQPVEKLTSSIDKEFSRLPKSPLKTNWKGDEVL